MIKNSVVLVPFPFDDFLSSKVRPALCLTSEIGRFGHIIIAFISSRLPKDIVESDLMVKKGSSYWKGSGLTVDSVIRLHKLVTIPKSLIKRKLGRVNKLTEAEINKKIIQLFDIN
ncbi:MAG: type II toxin-antitoxin system PemK/MazF family toxin [Chlorobi bacterium]|nr:type II toxin-antitoxin system PemK/MazF family toxin [Chlorobiota bacterium]